VEQGLAAADVRLRHVYTTPFETHNPLEPHSTIAVWKHDFLTLYESTQGVFDARETVAEVLGLDVERVRVIAPFVGGGFGSKGPVWAPTVLTAMAAQRLNRPVKLMLRRPQMFGPVGSRPRTRQTIDAGARRDGTLTALRHDVVAQTSSFDEFMESAGMISRMAYAAPNVATSHRLVPSDIGPTSYMRAPGWAPGSFALECAMDELAYAIDLDPVAFRLANYAETDLENEVPWSSKALRECYRIGAERFGWSRRPLRPGVLRDGGKAVGWGMATSIYPAHRDKASAAARLRGDGTVLVESGSLDIGTGTYTVMTQVAADALGISPARVEFRLGDTRQPKAPMAAGSMTAASVGSAVHKASRALRDKLITLAVGDRRSPVSGLAPAEVAIENGQVFARADASRGESFESFIARHGGRELDARADDEPGDESEHYGLYGFGAQFAEVHVDPELGHVRVSRLVGVFGIGRVLNAKTARSQLVGGMVWGLGMALHEHTVMDERLGRVVTANLADYHIPVQMDVPAIDVSWVDEHDPHVNPLGVKGIGEIGITGTAAAIANAVFHATGRRIRDLPVTLDKLLGGPDMAPQTPQPS
jgi:xanthine dehydrogenase YagR molybdenum-binding subunit